MYQQAPHPGLFPIDFFQLDSTDQLTTLN